MPERRMNFRRPKNAGPEHHPIHDSIFGEAEDEPKPMVDDTPTGASRARVYIDSPGEPGRFQPMRDVGDTDPTDRQPDGTIRR